MLNNFKVRELEMHQITITLMNDEIVVVQASEVDYEIKYMNRAVVAYPYCILVGNTGTGYGYNQRFEAKKYRIGKLYTFEGRTVEVKQLNKRYDGYVYVYGMQSADSMYIQGLITLEQRDSAHAYHKAHQDKYPEEYVQYGI